MLLEPQALAAHPSYSGTNLLAWRRLYLSKAKLKAVSRTSALLSGFAMIGMVEITLDKDDVDPTMLVIYAINTTLLVAVHLLALMISTCILPNIESVSATMSSIKDSPHESMHHYIDLAWAFSTVLGILLFLSEIAILCWLKFKPLGDGGFYAALAATCIIVPAAVAFVGFACHFYRKLANHKYDRTNRNLEELENIHIGLQNV